MSHVWPYKCITPNLDKLESQLGQRDVKEFEELYAMLLERETNDDQRDYVLLLGMERSLLLGIPLDTKQSPFKEFLERRTTTPRVVTTHLRVLLMNNHVEEAKVLYNSYPQSFYNAADLLFVRSLICLRDRDEIGWLEAIRGALKENPLHRPSITALATQELKLDFQIGALNHIQAFLRHEPLDVCIRALYASLLLKHGFYEQGRDEEEILAFIEPTFKPSAPPAGGAIP